MIKDYFELVKTKTYTFFTHNGIRIIKIFSNFYFYEHLKSFNGRKINMLAFRTSRFWSISPPRTRSLSGRTRKRFRKKQKLTVQAVHPTLVLIYDTSDKL